MPCLVGNSDKIYFSACKPYVQIQKDLRSVYGSECSSNDKTVGIDWRNVELIWITDSQNIEISKEVTDE